MSLKDTTNGYGWLSITLHWYTAAAVLALLFIGNTIATKTGADRAEILLLHTSIAITSYLFFWARIVLRFRYGHPGPLPKQRGPFFVLGKYAHFVLLGAIAVMLITGPLMVWSGGDSIGVWGWFEIPGPLARNLPMRDALHTAHRWSAGTIFALTLLHLGGVYKHSAFNQDGTFAKMLVPGKAEASPPGTDSAVGRAAAVAGSSESREEAPETRP
jgi:cytochrome b561